MPVIPTLERQGQEIKVKASLSYTAKPCLKKTNDNTSKQKNNNKKPFVPNVCILLHVNYISIVNS
jgi:hypothetical protein